MSDYQQQFHELRFKDRLSVADAVVLEHRIGLTKAANFVAEVDPWCYPHVDSPAFIGVKAYVQSVVAQATHAARSLSQFTDASITDFLLSPLLVKKGDRPNLVRKPKAQHTPKPRAVVTAAATVARKPSSQPVDLPIIEGIHLQNFRFPSLSPPHHPVSLLSLLIKHSPLPAWWHTCKRLITVVTIFSFLHICQTDNLIMNVAAPVDLVVEQAASATPVETRLDDDGVGYTLAEFEIELLT
jgi:hypothetical protein